MGANKYPIPSVPASVADSSQRDWMQKITSALKAVTGEMGSGAQLDFFSSTISSGGFDSDLPTTDGDEYDPFADEETPNPPVVTYNGGFTYVVMRIENHDHLRNIAYAEIWSSNLEDHLIENPDPNAEPEYDLETARNISLASEENVGGEGPALVGTATGGVFAHAVGHGFKGYYWTRFRNYRGDFSEFDTVLGTYVETALDPSVILAELENHILNTQLYQDLNTRVTLLDDPATGVFNDLTVITDALEQVVTSTAQYVLANDDKVVVIEEKFELIDGLSAQYTVKIDDDGNMAGFGLSSTTNQYDQSVHSDFIINVDHFGITAPGKETLTFGVDTENNRVTMDALYLTNITGTDAFFGNIDAAKLYATEGTIADAIIGKGHIDNAKIGEVLESDNYATSNGNSGWRIMKGGTAIFKNILARGDIVASDILANTIEAKHIKGGAVSSMASVTGNLPSVSTGAFVNAIASMATGVPANMRGNVMLMVNYQGGRFGSEAVTLGCKIFLNGAEKRYGAMSIEGNRTSSGAISVTISNVKSTDIISIGVHSATASRTISNITVNANRLTTLK